MQNFIKIALLSVRLSVFFSSAYLPLVPAMQLLLLQHSSRTALKHCVVIHEKGDVKYGFSWFSIPQRLIIMGYQSVFRQPVLFLRAVGFPVEG